MPPIYVAVLAREGAYPLRLLQELRRYWRHAGRVPARARRGRLEADDDDHIFTLHTYVAESDAQAREHAKAAYDLYVATRLYAVRHTYEDVVASGLCLFGSVDTVAAKLARMHAMRIRHVATLHNFGGLEPQLVERSMTLLAREALPRAASRVADAVG